MQQAKQKKRPLKSKPGGNPMRKAGQIAAWCVGLPVLFCLWVLDRLWGRLRAPLTRSRTGKVSPIPEQPAAHQQLAGTFKKRKPKILTDFGSHWPAFEKCTPAYLKSVFGMKSLTVHTAPFAQPNFKKDGSNQVEMLFAEFIEKVYEKDPTDTRYFAFAPAFGLLKMLKLFEPQVAGRQSDPPATGIFMGQKGQVTRLHYDWWHGCLVQISGRKKIVMFPPRESSRLSCQSPFAVPVVRDASKLPVDCMSADPEIHPEVFAARRFETVLQPGQMLYIPPFWWHEVSYLDASISLSFRYFPRWYEGLHPSLFHLALYQARWNLSQASAARNASVTPAS